MRRILPGLRIISSAVAYQARGLGHGDRVIRIIEPAIGVDRFFTSMCGRRFDIIQTNDKQWRIRSWVPSEASDTLKFSEPLPLREALVRAKLGVI